ncbi:MAG: tyrosine-type recombinase/integrase [Acidobacteria bacterium]|nr:tyrosine-type recombinase/integrase [Acidobacteriota bacterium]MDA1234197.1 tyrosine-type recombinase/integrase [Acidobacteriota bacterium]
MHYRSAWASGCKPAGLEGLRFHDLRRSAVRSLLDAGLDESSVMKIVGHRTRAMLDRYNIVSVKDVKRAAKTMDEWLEAKRSDAPSKPAKPVQ